MAKNFERKSHDDIESIVRRAIRDAVGFVESEIAPFRVKAQRYYDGEVDLTYEDGRSKVVATKVRDTVRATKPALMRVFLGTAHPVEFIPRGPEDAAGAQQATAFIENRFERHNGPKILADCFQDALVKKQGIAKAYWKTYQDTKIYTFTDLSDEEYTALVSEDDIEILEHSMETSMSVDEMGMEVELPTHSLKISRREEKGDLCIEAVPPEEFFVDANARDFDDAYVVAHRTEMRIADLLEMGFDYSEVADLSGADSHDSNAEVEIETRQGYNDTTDSEDSQDPTMKIVAVTDAYMKMDIDGTGVPVLHRFICGGGNYKLLRYEPADCIPFAKFEVDPEPHSFYGNSQAELIMDDQEAMTSVMRGILDNVAMTNNPRLAIVEGMVNVDDVLNNEIGAVVRQKQPGAVTPLTVPFVAGETLVAMQYMESTLEAKTGISRASQGVDDNILQAGVTASAVAVTQQAQASQIEYMVRNLAVGVKDLFRLMLMIYSKNVDEEQIMRLNNKFVPVDPRVWDADMDVMVNVGLGTGREQEKAAAYQQILALQMQVFQGYGPGNGIVSLQNIRNTLADMLATSGIRMPERYFGDMSEETEAQMAQSAQQSQGGASDPNAAFLQAEQIKAQGRAQADAQRAQIDMQKAIIQDDRERDKMAQDYILKNTEMQGKLGIQANTAALKAEQERDRYGMGGGV